jgi:hypothetical protein
MTCCPLLRKVDSLELGIVCGLTLQSGYLNLWVGAPTLLINKYRGTVRPLFVYSRFSKDFCLLSFDVLCVVPLSSKPSINLFIFYMINTCS